jgi:hypothetical protein
VTLGEGELEFVERHLTTGRFAECAGRAGALEGKLDGNGSRLVWNALRVACLAAAGKTTEARGAAGELINALAGASNLEWVFAGTRHFVSRDSAFASQAPAWLGLFEALEQGSAAKVRASLAALALLE